MEDGIDVVFPQAIHHFGWIRNITMAKGEVHLILQASSIVQGCTIIELVE